MAFIKKGSTGKPTPSGNASSNKVAGFGDHPMAQMDATLIDKPFTGGVPVTGNESRDSTHDGRGKGARSDGSRNRFS